MRIAYSLGSLLTINQILNCARFLSKYEVDSIWIPETWGMENFSMLGMVSQKATVPKIGSSIINIYSRSPTLIAMGAMTLDTVSNGRLILGLGTSSVPIVEDFHGYKFENPVRRMKEYVSIIRIATSGKKIDFAGEFFNLKGFQILIKPIRSQIPIYLAAVNQKMIDLSLDIADGVIFYLRPLEEMKKTISKMQKKKKIEVSCQIITAVSEDSDKARERGKSTLAFYVAVGKIYRKFLSENGFKNETEVILDEFRKTGFSKLHQCVSDSMADKLTICGTPNECCKKLERFTNAGITLPIIQFNPVGNINKSFELLAKTFSEMK